MKIEKKHYWIGGIILALILIYVFRKQIMRAFGASEDTIQKFCGGGWVGRQYRMGGEFPSPVVPRPSPRPMPINIVPIQFPPANPTPNPGRCQLLAGQDIWANTGAIVDYNGKSYTCQANGSWY